MRVDLKRDKIKFKLYSISSGLLMALAWPAIGDLTAIIFLSFVPLLWVDDQLTKKGSNGLAVFGHAYLAFFVFNLMTTWWIYFASDWGAAIAIICNSLFMAIVFWLFHLTKKKVGRKEGFFALLIYWIAFEYLHLNWELSWPWLTLGNVFSNSPENVQWFEYTGVLGGSALIILVNIFFYHGLKHLRLRSTLSLKYFSLSVLIVLGSILISRFGFSNQKKAKSIEVVIVQPNIDPYFNKFSGISEKDQIDLMVKLAQEQLTDSTDLVILPETAFPQPYWEHDLANMYGIETFQKLIDQYLNLRVVTGILSDKLYLDDGKLSVTAKKLQGKVYYDSYNSSIHLDSTKNIAIHRKSKLVLGAEKIPFIKYLPWLKSLSVSLGGTTGRYGTQENPSVFFSENKKKGIAPIICYESVYGEYVNKYAQQGAQLYVIITNDGWWDNSPGYKQHLAYARLRAVEGRRDIVRSANTGISAIINSRGEIVERTEWWVPTALKGKVQLNDEITFYIKYGDYLGRIAAFVAVLLVLLTIMKTLNKTEQRLKAGRK